MALKHNHPRLPAVSPAARGIVNSVAGNRLVKDR